MPPFITLTKLEKSLLGNYIPVEVQWLVKKRVRGSLNINIIKTNEVEVDI